MESKEKVTTSLKTAKEALVSLSEALDQKKDEFIRDSVIKRFEFTFELSWKAVRAYLLFVGKTCSSPRNCIRLAAQEGLVNQPEEWFAFLEDRNLTSHTYSTRTAEKVYQSAKNFEKSVKQLLSSIEKKIESND